METYFSGSHEIWLQQMPEGFIDTLITILKIDPKQEMTSKGYSSRLRRQPAQTVKECLWDELVYVVHRWGMQSPTEIQTSPSHLKKHVTDIKDKLSEALEVLNELEYESLFENGSMTKEFIVAENIRDASIIIQANADNRRYVFVGNSVIKQEYDKKGIWGKYCPFDHDLEVAVQSLHKIMAYVDKVSEDSKKVIAARGKKKKGKENHDTLIWALCHMYKKYTGKAPVSWNTGTSASNAGQITGAVIPFLQAVLPYTFYGYDKSADALQKKIMRIRKSKKFKDIWTDSKK